MKGKKKKEVSNIQLYFNEKCNISQISLLMSKDIENENEAKQMYFMQLKAKKNN